MKTKDTIAILSLVLVLVLVSGLVVGGLFMFSTIGATPMDEDSYVGTSVFCANNPALNGEARIRDSLATSTAYLNGTLLVENLRNGQIREVAVGVYGSEYVSIGNLECGNPDGYKIYVLGAGETLNSQDSVEITASELDAGVMDISKTIMATQFSLPTTRNIYDKNTRADFTTIGDDFLNVELSLDVAEAFGRSAYVTISFDDDAEVWDLDTLAISFNGQRLSEATLSVDESRALRNKEIVFNLPSDLSGTRPTFDIAMDTHADFEYGVDASEDVVFEIWAKGDVVEDEEVLRNVAFSGDSISDNLNTPYVVTFTH